MTLTVKGIVLRTVQYGDFDKLCTILTEQGKIFFKARGIRSVTNKNAAGCQMFVYSEFQLEKRAEKFFLRTARPLFTTVKAGSSIETIALASYFAELCEDTAPDAETAKAALRLLMNALYLLGKNDRPQKLIKAVFELRLLAAGGLMPLLDSCAVCGEASGEKEMYFRLTEGDLVCKDCKSGSGENLMPLSRGTLLLVRRAVSVPEEEAYAVRVEEKTLREFARFSERYLIVQLDRNYPSLQFYKEVELLPE